jgi:hypothetical protein
MTKEIAAAFDAIHKIKDIESAIQKDPYKVMQRTSLTQ